MRLIQLLRRGSVPVATGIRGDALHGLVEQMNERLVLAADMWGTFDALGLRVGHLASYIGTEFAVGLGRCSAGTWQLIPKTPAS